MEVRAFPDAGSAPGLVIASRLPITDAGVISDPAGTWDRPRAVWLEVESPAGPIVFVNAHLRFPVPLESLPCPYCPWLRDAQAQALATFSINAIDRGRHVVLAGDFNLSEREVAYQDLRSAGLVDAARGLTWRFLPLEWAPPLLRIDYVFADPHLVPTAAAVACAGTSSDHCPVVVGFSDSSR
jgi:endonuclease/exonuclease/phosphatase family metal-dependent hydrolase